MAPAPDQATPFSGLARSMSIPASFNSAAMSPTESMNSLSSLEKQLMDQPGGNVVHSSAPAGGRFSRSATTSPTTNYWGHATAADMQQILGGSASATPQELLGSGMASSDWQQLLDAKSSAYKYPPPVSMAPSLARGTVMENAKIRELLTGRVGGAPAAHKSWSPLDTVAAGITVDPSKGGLALQGVGLATSHCLAQFTSDPAFAERAAKFSSFGNGKYPQIALPLPINDAHCKPRSRSSESSSRLSRTSSNQNSGATKKLAAAVVAEMEEKSAASVRAASTAAEVSCNMDVDGVGSNDKSPSRAASVPELEAIEGASLATMDRTHEQVEVAAARETNSCSVTEQHQASAASPARSPTGSDDSDRRKRKQSPADKSDVDCKVADVVDSKPKRCKGENDESVKAKAERSCSENSGDSGSPRALKDSNNRNKILSKQDYIHVRARRGQATDSHSLAERVRREKISERMKYLQDLVPGCNKVTGKAVMLDEIINYVQSLQRQVESLSMKLASVNPGPSTARLDYNFETALNKDMLQPRMSGSLGGPESSATFGMLQHQQQHPSQGPMMGGHCGLDFRSMGTSMDGYLRRSNSSPINVQSGITSLDTFGDDVSQSIGWDGELQSIVNQMGFAPQGRYGSAVLDGHQSQLPVGHMKVEM